MKQLTLAGELAAAIVRDGACLRCGVAADDIEDGRPCVPCVAIAAAELAAAGGIAPATAEGYARAWSRWEQFAEIAGYPAKLLYELPALEADQAVAEHLASLRVTYQLGAATVAKEWSYLRGYLGHASGSSGRPPSLARGGDAGRVLREISRLASFESSDHPRALRPSDLRIILAALWAEVDVAGRRVHPEKWRLKPLRDAAIFLLGFAVAARPGELAALAWSGVTSRPGGLDVTLVGKTGARTVPVLRSTSDLCPVRALHAWSQAQFAVAASRRKSIAEAREFSMDDAVDAAFAVPGYIFPRIDRHGRMAGPIGAEGISTIITERATLALGPHGWSGRSLRAGLAVTGLEEGVATPQIRRVTGHRSDRSLETYLRDASDRKNRALRLL